MNGVISIENTPADVSIFMAQVLTGTRISHIFT